MRQRYSAPRAIVLRHSLGNTQGFHGRSGVLFCGLTYINAALSYPHLPPPPPPPSIRARRILNSSNRMCSRPQAEYAPTLQWRYGCHPPTISLLSGCHALAMRPPRGCHAPSLQCYRAEPCPLLIGASIAERRPHPHAVPFKRVIGRIQSKELGS